uniref:Uncharacterized protein n=1 Tax=Manihot esculenta TaxID=3983 RepID=A0A2C9V9K7_MANES
MGGLRPWNCNSEERKFSMDGKTRTFSHVQIFSTGTTRQFPIELINNLCQH